MQPYTVTINIPYRLPPTKFFTKELSTSKLIVILSEKSLISVFSNYFWFPLLCKLLTSSPNHSILQFSKNSNPSWEWRLYIPILRDNVNVTYFLHWVFFPFVPPFYFCFGHDLVRLISLYRFLLCFRLFLKLNFFVILFDANKTFSLSLSRLCFSEGFLL